MVKSLRRIDRLFSRVFVSRSVIGMWKKRAQQYGVRAVLNIGHSEEEVDAVTKMQKEKIFPVLKNALTGKEKTILDFGCGPGSFTSDLAELVKGDAMGVDPAQQSLFRFAEIVHSLDYFGLNERISMFVGRKYV